MNFELWNPIYQKILDDFKFDRKADDYAAKILSDMIIKRDDLIDRAVLLDIVNGKDVIVCGNAPSLKDDIERLDCANFVIIVADGATTVVLDSGIVPDIIVTDLDGDVKREVLANKSGSVVVIHAHGNNIDALEKWVPLFNGILCTTQSKPFGSLHNFGGFTDGDRAVYIAYEFNAKNIKLAGFNFEDLDVTDMKKKKLKWAKYLIDRLDLK